MKKLLFTIAAILIINIVPLMLNPVLIFHYKTLVLVVVAASLWITQPAFSIAEMNRNKSSDKFSILLILIASSVSGLVAVTEWAYFSDKENVFDFFSVIGLIFMISGVLIRVWAIRTLKDRFTATVSLKNSHELVIKGPYKIIRHPSYSGAFLAIIGASFFLNDVWSIFVAVILMTGVYYFRISVEELTLVKYFGSKYNTYKQKTKKMVPFIW